MDTFADAVEELTSAQAAGFDVKQARAETVIQEGIRHLAARSHWIKAMLNLGPTVADQAAYTLPERVIRLFEVAINNDPYTRRNIHTLWDLRTGRSTLEPGAEEGGVFAEVGSEDGKSKSIELLPTPEEGEAEITGLASIYPEPLAASDELPFPADHRRAVVDYATGILYEGSDENQATGAFYRERADGTAEALRLFANARSGSGPWKIPVAGHRRR